MVQGFNLSQIPDLMNKVIIVTGGHTGIGFGTSLELARNGARVYIAGRSKERVEEAMSAIKKEISSARLEVLQPDLADLCTVQFTAESFRQ